MKSGWFIISRKFFDHFLWKENREYSKAEAWLDLIYQARYTDKPAEQLINGRIVTWDRGHLIASVRFLKKRWKWRSNTKVESFLIMLENEDMIRRKIGQGITQISICNYDTYQIPKDTPKDTDKTQKGQAEDETVKKGVKKGVNKYTVQCDYSWDGEQSINYKTFIEKFNELYNRSLRITDEKRENIRSRLKDFTGAEILKAWEARKNNEWLNGEGKDYLGDWAAAMRNSEKVDKYLNGTDDTIKPVPQYLTRRLDE